MKINMYWEGVDKNTDEKEIFDYIWDAFLPGFGDVYRMRAKSGGGQDILLKL